jgi:hypothetical protein
MPRLTITHTTEHEELAALYALDLLEGAELIEFQVHLAVCALCYDTVKQDELALSALSAGAPEMDPSPGFRERLLEQAAQELRGIVRGAPRPRLGATGDAAPSQSMGDPPAAGVPVRPSRQARTHAHKHWGLADN